MIRLINAVNLKSARNTGLVFHFEDNPKTIISIYKTGWEHTHPERVIKEMPKSKADRYQVKDKSGKPNGTTPSFFSTTQNPSAMLQYHSDSWRYGMILDNAILSANNYSTPFPYEFTADDVEDHDGMDFIDYSYNSKNDRWIASGGMLGNLTLSDSQIDSLGDLEGEEASFDNKFAIVRTGPQSYRLYYNFGDVAYTEKVKSYRKVKGKAETVYQDVTVNPSKISELPGVLFEILKSSGHQSEQRYYEKPGKNLQIKKALKGLLIPDVEYFSKNVQDCAAKCSIPQENIYIYRDWKYSKSSREYKDFIARAETEYPDIKRKYSLPSYL